MENSKLSDVKGKELVAAGHALAKAIGMDTPLIGVAKLVSELATRLDCALVRGDAHKQDVMTWEKAMMAAIGEDGVGCVVRAIAALKAERDALATELSAVEVIHDECAFVTDDDYEACPEKVQKIIRNLAVMQIPATDAYLNSVRADAVQKLWRDSLNEVGHVLGDIGAYRDASEAAGIVHDEIKERVEDFAAQLRAGKDGE